MSALYWTDIAVNSDTEQLIPCSSNSEVSAICFGGSVSRVGDRLAIKPHDANIDARLVPIPEPGRDIRVCYAFGHVYAVVKGQNTGNCIVCRDDGLVATLGPTYGNQCVGIAPMSGGLMAVWVMSATVWMQSELNYDLTKLSDVPRAIPPAIAGTSQGFLDLIDYEPLWTDLNRITTLPNGVQLALWMTRGNYTIGQGFVNPAQVSCWDGAQMSTVWLGNTSFPPRINVNAQGQAMAGIATDAITVISSPFPPYTVTPEPTPIPPQPIPPIPVPPEPVPVPPTPEPTMPAYTLIFPSSALTSPTICTQGPHQDSGKPGALHGCVSLHRADGLVATCGGGNLSWKIDPNPGADERFQDGGNVYIGLPADGSVPYAFPKSGAFGQ